MRLTYTDISPTLNLMYEVYTGRKSSVELPFNSMVNVFKTGLDVNDDNLYNTITTILAKTVFAVRNYKSRLAVNEWDVQKYGDYIRKITPIIKDSNLTNDEWNISVEESKGDKADWKAGTKPEKYDVLVTTSSGGKSFSRKYTVYRNQLNAAFDSEQGVADFFSMMMTEFYNIFEIDRENIARSVIGNVITGLLCTEKTKCTNDNSQVWHVLSQYNAETGLALTADTVLQPQNFRDFMIWFSAELDTLRGKLGIHSTAYHGNISGKEVNRHTDVTEQKLIINRKFSNYFSKNGAALYKPDILALGAYEEIDFWSDLNNPLQVKGSPTILCKDGTTKDVEGVTADNVVGLLTDVDMFGYVPIDVWSAPEPYNARFGFQNTWLHYTYKMPVDWTENAVVICLD